MLRRTSFFAFFLHTAAPPTAFLAMGVLLLLTFLDYASGSFSSPLNHMLFAWWDRTVRTGSSYHRSSRP
jgi:hypothetical protein